MRLFCLSIDVEPDCSPTWHYAEPIAFEGVRTAIQKILHPLFMEYGVVPTYLVNNVVMEDAESVEVLGSLPGQFELGTHLHPEFIEPDKVFSSYGGKKGEMNLCLLPPDIEQKKIASATELFRRVFGFQPTSFRAGRFSAGSNTIRSLEGLGYSVDTSVTPLTTWNDATRGEAIDFSKVPLQPYYVGTDEGIAAPSREGTILEVPVTIVQLRSLLRTRIRWLRPYVTRRRDLVRICRTVFDRVDSQHPTVLNMMFHNVEVLPGLSPYCQTDREAASYVSALRHLFEFLLENNTSFVALKGLPAFIPRTHESEI